MVGRQCLSIPLTIVPGIPGLQVRRNWGLKPAREGLTEPLQVGLLGCWREGKAGPGSLDFCQVIFEPFIHRVETWPLAGCQVPRRTSTIKNES